MTLGSRAAVARGRPLAGSPARVTGALVFAALAGCASVPEAPASPPPPPQPVVLAPAPQAPAPAQPDRVLTPESGTPLARPGASTGGTPSTTAQATAPIDATPSGSGQAIVAAPSGPSPATGSTGAAPAPVASMGAPGGLGIATGVSAAPATQAVIRLVAEPGLYRCELNRRVTLRRVAADGRSVVLNWLGKDHTLDAVQARTGALRFENPASGLMWLVIVGKSMLLDTHRGQQLANECKL